MPQTSLRLRLSLGLSTLVALAVVLVTMATLGVLIPRLTARADAENEVLSSAAAAQIDSHLANFSSQLNRLGRDIGARPTLEPDEMRLMVDTLTQAEVGIESIYVIDSDDRVIESGLPMDSRARRDNQLGIDFSGRGFVPAARVSGHDVWSDTYLSARGNVVVALATPIVIPARFATEAPTRGILVGELNLHGVSRFAGLLSSPGNVLTVIIDRRGNVVGHPDAARALRQDNIGDLAPLNPPSQTQKIARFRMDTAEFLGSTAIIPQTGWTVLVAQPTERAFAIVRSTFYSLALASIVALAGAIIAALVASRRIMRYVTSFARHVEAVADGHYEDQIPQSSIDEIDRLSQHLHRVAGTMLEREARLRESETVFRMLVESAPQGIALIEANGQFTLINAAFTRLLGYTLDEIPNLTAWWTHAIPDEKLRQRALANWHALLVKDAATEDERRQFRVCRSDGKLRDIELAIEHLPDTRILATFSDITERRQNEIRLQRAAKVFSHAREGILITDANGNLVEVNERFTSITGYSRDESVGQPLALLNSPLDGDESFASLWQSLVQDGFWHGEVRVLNKHGGRFTALTSITAVCDAAGTVQNYVALFTDITQLKDYQRQLEHIAHFDPLTGLPNRVLLADRLRLAMTQSLRRSTSLAVLYLDLDGFKPINDQHGHNVGDHLLLTIAQRMKEALRDGDTIARIGGDEFVAVLVDLDREQDCEPVIERLLAAAASPVLINNVALQVSASIGATFFPRDTGDADLLMRHADQAMYLAKQTGKRRFCVFDIALDTAAANLHRIIDEIRHAMAQSEFVLYYQPKVNLQAGTVIGVEALIRWQHPERGLLPPSVFLPAIEGHPLSIELGEWVIETALGQMDRWREIGIDLPISVNIGGHQLLRSRFNERLAMLLARHPDIPPDWLELEILETSALEDLAQISSLMESCRALGVRFSLDDFGTGYSSLAHLKYLPANVLKIDRSFIGGMLDDADDLAIVDGIIGLASVFNRQVIAEGVELAAHGTCLLALGCPLVQGFGIARPMPAANIPQWVSDWKPAPEWSIAGATAVDALETVSDAAPG